MDQGFISLVPVLKNVPNKIASLDLPDAKGAKVRSRFQWAEEGEASTKFFLRLEKNKRSVSLISAMRKEDGSLASDINSICDSWVSFYFLLFTAGDTDPDVQDELLGDLTSLSPSQRDLCDSGVGFLAF